MVYKGSLLENNLHETITILITMITDIFQITVSKASDGTVKSELTLARVGWKDEGTYTCMAREVTSEASEADKPTKQEVLLEVYGKP